MESLGKYPGERENYQPMLGGKPGSYSESKSIQDDGYSDGTSSQLDGSKANGEEDGQPARKKRERRSKDDSSTRNYICGCGKQYLSYAALYTHSKVKHDGIFPDGTTTLHKKKQGRPKKEEVSENKQMSVVQKRKAFTNSFIEFLDKIEGARRREGENEKFDPSTTMISDEIVCNNYLDPLYQTIQSLSRQVKSREGDDLNKKFDELLAESVGKSYPCDTVFAFFSLYSAKYVSEGFYKELLLFLSLYRDAMNEYGWEKLKTLTNKPPVVDSNQLFCKVQNAEIVPDISNTFILDFFPNKMQIDTLVKKPASLNFLGIDDKKLCWVILLIKNFCGWLHLNKFSEGKVEMRSSHN